MWRPRRVPERPACRHEPIASPLSKNSTVPAGARTLGWSGVTTALNLTALPTSASEPNIVTDVEVASLLIGKLCATLVEPITSEPGVGVNTAVSCAGEVAAANAVPHVTVTVGLGGVGVGTAAHPAIGLPPFSNATAPEGDTLLRLDATVATSVTT